MLYVFFLCVRNNRKLSEKRQEKFVQCNFLHKVTRDIIQFLCKHDETSYTHTHSLTVRYVTQRSFNFSKGLQVLEEIFHYITSLLLLKIYESERRCGTMVEVHFSQSRNTTQSYVLSWLGGWFRFGKQNTLSDLNEAQSMNIFSYCWKVMNQNDCSFPFALWSIMTFRNDT